MSAAARPELREEEALHGLADGHDVAGGRQHSDEEEHVHEEQAGEEERPHLERHGSDRQVSGSRTAAASLEGARSSLRPGLAPDLAAWDTRTTASYLPADTASLLPPPSFKPFFSLIEDGGGEFHHPNVHYVFADDEDQGVLTSAALAAIDHQDTMGNESEEVEERTVVLDFQVDGKTVAAVTSLSGNWQAIKAEVSQAPSWGESGQGKDRGLMLKVSGKETSTRQSRVPSGQDIDALVERFGKQLDSLDEALGAEEAKNQGGAVDASESRRMGSGVG